MGHYSKPIHNLVENYKTTSTSDIVKQHFLGTLRVFLPRALGGVDGINTLDPLARRMKTQIDPDKIRNLTVLSVSLQAGPIKISIRGDGEVGSWQFEPEDIREFVLGSASIPVAVEPRRARLWMHGAIEKFEGDRLTFRCGSVGLPDPACEVRFNQWLLPCEYLSSTKVRISPKSPAVWRYVVRLPRLSLKDRSRLEAMIANAGSEFHADVEVSTIHQLVDGGVTESIQVQGMDEILGISDSDQVIVLTTGELGTNTMRQKDVRGGLDIGLASFEYLWEKYQQDTVLSALADAYYRPLLAASRRYLNQAKTWHENVRTTLGEEEFRKLESQMQILFPIPTPRFEELLNDSAVSQAPIFHIFTPDARIFTGTFDTDMASINAALYFGCAMVANYAKNPKRENRLESDEFDTVRIIMSIGVQL